MVLMLLSLILIVAQTAADKAVCSKPVDVVFLVDGANSISGGDFNLTLKFLQTLAGQFDISASGARIAAVGFGENIIEYFPFGKLNTLAEVKEEIGKSLPQRGVKTNTFKALAHARQKLFNQARPGVPRVNIIITDGVPQDTKLADKEVNETISNGIVIIVLGITSISKDKLGLAKLVSPPSKTNLITVDNFKALVPDVASKVAKQACENSGTASPSGGPAAAPGKTSPSGSVTSSGETSSGGPVTSSGETSSSDSVTTPGETSSSDSVTTPGETSSSDSVTTPGETSSSDSVTTPAGESTTEQSTTATR